MAGSLIKIDEFTTTSAVASVTIGGGSSGSSGLNASIDSTYDVYMLVFNNFVPTTDGHSPQMRVTESGTPNTTANYDSAAKNLNAGSAFDNSSEINQTSLDLSLNTGDQTGEQLNSIIYIFNANNSSEYTFLTMENSMFAHTAQLRGKQGGGVFTVASAVDGIQFIGDSTNIDNGNFVLYGLKK